VASCIGYIAINSSPNDSIKTVKKEEVAKSTEASEVADLTEEQRQKNLNEPPPPILLEPEKK
jgi:hypothetical protein